MFVLFNLKINVVFLKMLFSYYISFNVQVESGAAVAKTSIYYMCIPKQPDPSEIPQLKSELETHVTYTYVSKPTWNGF